LHPDEEGTIAKLYGSVEAQLKDGSLSPDQMAEDLGMSLPELEEMVTSLTGRSTEEFLRAVKGERFSGVK
jgi:hypothetical protein